MLFAIASSMETYSIRAQSEPERALPVELIDGITREEFLHIDESWRAFKDGHDHGRPRLSLPENHLWNWQCKSVQPPAGSFRFIGVKYQGVVEGLLMLSLKAVASKLPVTRNLPVLYVEYLETAPWNQLAYAGSSRRFLGVGTVLISAAIDESFRHGCAGRLSLHTLDDAKPFYLSQGFISLGYDPEEGFDYLERGSDHT